ncbi:MAG TPA: hypothetical protein VF742_06525 [Terracidiphilus sp.]
MELLLNLIWLSLALGVWLAFVEKRRRSAQLAAVPCRGSLVALACVMVLLFPVVSASDDLHPAQAVVEEASKRTQLVVAPLHLVRTGAPQDMQPAILSLCTMVALAVLGPSDFLASEVSVLDRPIIPSAGRAPPSRWR